MQNKKAIYFILVLFVAGSILMRFFDQTPPGIVPFEFAHTADNAKNIVNQWQATNVLHLKKWSFYLDYVYLLVYATLLFLLLKQLGVKNKVLLLLPFFAAGFDVIENSFLLPFLFYKGSNFGAHTAFYAAYMKFVLIIFSIFLILSMFIKKLFISKA